MDSDFDLESLVHLEQMHVSPSQLPFTTLTLLISSFYNQGFTDGFAHGKIHGLIEGRALGREKGFEMWEELGFYEGFAKGWKAILDSGLVGKGNGDTAHLYVCSFLSNASPMLRLVALQKSCNTTYTPPPRTDQPISLR